MSIKWQQYLKLIKDKRNLRFLDIKVKSLESIDKYKTARSGHFVWGKQTHIYSGIYIIDCKSSRHWLQLTLLLRSWTGTRHFSRPFYSKQRSPLVWQTLIRFLITLLLFNFFSGWSGSQTFIFLYEVVSLPHIQSYQK